MRIDTVDVFADNKHKIYKLHKVKQSLTESNKVKQSLTKCMTVQKDAKLNRAKCLFVAMFVKFKVIELLMQLKRFLKTPKNSIKNI